MIDPFKAHARAMVNSVGEVGPSLQAGLSCQLEAYAGVYKQGDFSLYVPAGTVPVVGARSGDDVERLLSGRAVPQYGPSDAPQLG
jgi:hypothetical protein